MVSRQVAKVTGDTNSDVYGFTPVTDYLGLIGIVRGTALTSWTAKAGALS
jgi:hypothetical protein